MNRGTQKDQSIESMARQMAVAAGFDPDGRVARENAKDWPRWCEFRPQAMSKLSAEAARAAAPVVLPPRAAQYQGAPLRVFGTHDENTLTQMRSCMEVGNVVAGAICADGHVGYAQAVGGVVAYEGQVSISGVGFDIACGNMAVRLDTPFSAIRGQVGTILADIRKHVSFGVGRVNDTRVQHPLLDDDDAWKASGMEDYRAKAAAQLGTVGSGNHYVDLMTDERGMVWIGVHFGSRGLGHTSATKYLKLAGGKDGMYVPPAVVDENGAVGTAYLAAMALAGRYAYAGREWVVERVREIVGGAVQETIHNHHNYAWREEHNGRNLWVVRKGATPAFPGQRGFIGGSMGDDAVIVEGVDSPDSAGALYSTVHGAGRLFGRMAAKRAFKREQMDAWLRERGVMVSGGDVDESPMAYRRLPDVLAHHAGTIRVLHTLSPFAVAMAGPGEFDPYKD